MQSTSGKRTLRSNDPRHRLKKWTIRGLVVTALAAGGGGAYYKMKASSASELDRLGYKVVRKDLSHTLQLTGKVVPVSSMAITPRQSGRLVDLAVQEGAQVQANDLLFTMRLEAEGQTELLQKRAEVRSLELEVQAATGRLEEKKPVRDLLGSASVVKEESELEKLRLDLKAARERLAVLETDLGLEAQGAKKAVQPKPSTLDALKNGLIYVRSPRAGIVTLVDKRPGDFIIGGAGGDATATERTVMVVADMSSMLVRTRVLEADLRYVKLDLPVVVKLDAYPDVSYTGVVKRIGGQGRVDTKAGYTYFDVDVSVDQQDARVLPEMNATIELIFARREKVLTLPIAAVALFPDRAAVHVRDPKDPKGYVEKSVTVGIVNESEAEITAGLNEGDEVMEIDFATLQLDEPKGPVSKGSQKS